ncbi:hypothetical protein JN11_04221 [Mucilaginibacter frigoritolerans]|uniref:Nucleotide-binding universal stress UspA family protein n=1 Tax=Mucilaginibacter frigoritolerans TaxID=652788 RepID=A0A562TS76_9SPHI|nr:hypothetical protein [Mucilaginibacter frigoritolerans]TWI95946.1 hypothetical protein JN11_04221 [Mucilaginibacter frigoritolerans]
MKTILIINDNSPEAKHAAEFALTVAQKMQANIMLANTFVKTQKTVELVTVGSADKIMIESYQTSKLSELLKALNNKEIADFKPEIEELDISNMDESKLSEMINLNHTWMIIKGMSDTLPATVSDHNLNIHTVLNKVLCPLFLIPASWQIKDIERMVYIADLRYCRIEIVRYLAELARPLNADLSIAHTSAKGLPDMAEKYALAVFSDEICNNVKYERLLFNNIKEKDLSKTVDVLINGMHNDVLVMVNHRFHFEEILGRYITDTLPVHLSVPLLIFPY